MDKHQEDLIRTIRLLNIEENNPEFTYNLVKELLSDMTTRFELEAVKDGIMRHLEKLMKTSPTTKLLNLAPSTKDLIKN